MKTKKRATDKTDAEKNAELVKLVGMKQDIQRFSVSRAVYYSFVVSEEEVSRMSHEDFKHIIRMQANKARMRMLEDLDTVIGPTLYSDL